MRIRLVSFLWLFTGALWAQVEQTNNYNISQQQVQAPLPADDCYQSWLAKGMAAQKRGDCTQAIRCYQEAQRCFGVAAHAPRRAELEKKIAECDRAEKNKTNAASGRAAPANGRPALAGTAPVKTRGRYPFSAEFVQFDSANCFGITRREADRAFARGYWEDAQALYRAAKNCADADQAKRQSMNDRISACRQAAEDELRLKEQEAVRQARHAIAINRADNARQRLRLFDRTMAFRMADFANSYIAPDDNPACLQVMLDAWNYVPAVHSDLIEDYGAFKVPFVYQLAENLGDSVRIRIYGKGNQAKLYAFSPLRHQLQSWNLGSFEPIESIQMDTTLKGFEIAPDGTLVFFSKNELLFWRNARSIYRLNAPRNNGRMAFDARRNAVFYFDGNEETVFALDISPLFAARGKNTKRDSYISPPRRITVSEDGDQLLDIALGQDELWLGYRDSLIVLKSGVNAKEAWTRSLTVPVICAGAGDCNGIVQMKLYPDERRALFTTSSQTVLAGSVFTYLNNKTDTLRIEKRFEFLPLSFTYSPALLAYLKTEWDGSPNKMYLYDPFDNQYVFGVVAPNSEYYNGYSGALAPGDDGLAPAWFAAVTTEGSLKIWDLTPRRNTANASFAAAQRVTLTNDGGFVGIEKDMELKVLRTEALQADEPVYREQMSSLEENLLSASRDWLSIEVGDSIVLSRWNPAGGARRLVYEAPLGMRRVDAFDYSGKYYAYTIFDDSVVVVSLESGLPLAGRRFDGTVGVMQFLPGATELVVQRVSMGDAPTSTMTIPKIWNYQQPKARLRSVQLHGYTSYLLAADQQGQYIAFSSGVDVRVFRLNNLVDEAILINALSGRNITCIAFHPDGALLATGYDDGTVIFWDVNTGQLRFQLAAPSKKVNQNIVSMQFSEGGSRMNILTADQTIRSYDLDPVRIRANIQNETRQLVSFSSNEIRDFDLDQALNYPYNFERLAASGDKPLLRAFFDFYRQEAFNSNNIDRVRYNCERALALFQKLDDATRKVLQPTLLEMYDDFSWKLLLRGKAAEAQELADLLRRNFEQPPSATKTAAHAALLRNDLRNAAMLYADWTIHAYEIGQTDYTENYQINLLPDELNQLLDYELLNTRQKGFVCQMFGDIYPGLENAFCADSVEQGLVQMDAKSNLRWKIFLNVQQANSEQKQEAKVQLLTDARDAARKLLRLDPVIGRETYEKTTLELAWAYQGWAEFEQGNKYAVQHSRSALDVLQENTPYRKQENERLNALATVYLALGNYLLSADKFEEADQNYQLGLAATRPLLENLQNNAERLNEAYNLVSNLHVQRGLSLLFQNKADQATAAFETAGELLPNRLNGLFLGHAALLQGDQESALLLYGDVFNEELMGRALGEIDQLAERFPARRDSLNAFAKRLSRALLATHPDFDTTQVAYYFAGQKVNHFSGTERWDSALYWGTLQLRSAERLLNKPDASDLWTTAWLDAHLSQSYYLLFRSQKDTAALSRAIRYALSAEKFVETQYAYYPSAPFLKTNLGHAYLLRQAPGDRQRAVDTYKAFLESINYGADNLEVLIKDFRDLYDAGVRWPDLPGLIREIKPDAKLTPQTWKSIGVDTPPDR